MKKKKPIALPVVIQGGSDEDNEENIEISLLAKKVKHFMRNKNYYPNKKPLGRGKRQKESKEGICYECKKLDHLRFDCPQLKKESKKKKRVLLTTWSNSEYSSSEKEQQEVANVCFMAHDEEVQSNSHSDFSLIKLYEAFNELIDDHKTLKYRYKNLKSLNQTLIKRINLVTKEKDKLIKEKQLLDHQKEELKKLSKNLIKKMSH